MFVIIVITIVIIVIIIVIIIKVHSTAADAGRAGASQSAVEVPEGAEGEVARVLQSEDYYEVLGVRQDADAETLKRAKRQKSLSTHPDKLHQAPGSNEAFARVTEVGLTLLCGRFSGCQFFLRHEIWCQPACSVCQRLLVCAARRFGR